MYYQLQNHCILVEGIKRGAIYDLKEGKVFSVNQGAVEFLKECRLKKISHLLDTDLEANKNYLSFLDNLSKRNLGAFYSERQGGGWEEKISLSRQSTGENPPYLDFLWLELTNACNNRCLHCYAASSPGAQGFSLPHERWLSLISEAKELGASSIQLIGGEPLLYPKWRELAEKAVLENYGNIEIFTNATLITDDDVDFFAKNKINIATTIYADNALVHDAVTLKAGSFEKTMGAIKKILAAKVPLRVASVIMRTNEDQVENIMNLCQKLGVADSLPDVVRPSGRGSDEEILPVSYRKAPLKPPFYTDAHSFFLAQKYHSCLFGKIAISSGGDVMPCIFARGCVCGNVLENHLNKIMESLSLKECWHTTKDLIEKCRDCEYRYACPDCRPLAQGHDQKQNWLAKPPACPYDPYTGVWS